MSAAKTGENTTRTLNCYFSNYIDTLVHQTKYQHKKNQIYFLFGRLFSIKAKKTYTDQSKLRVFLLCSNRNDSQTFKSSSCKNVFLQCVCYRCNLLQWIFFIPCDNWKTSFFAKVCRYFEICSTTMLLLSLKQVLERSPYYMLFPQ